MHAGLQLSMLASDKKQMTTCFKVWAFTNNISLWEQTSRETSIAHTSTIVLARF